MVRDCLKSILQLRKFSFSNQKYYGWSPSLNVPLCHSESSFLFIYIYVLLLPSGRRYDSHIKISQTEAVVQRFLFPFSLKSIFMLLISTAATLNTATTEQSFSQKGHAQTQGKSKVLPPRTLPGDINHAGAKIGQEFYINVISNIVSS